jgi:hypothetical protein
LCHEKLLTYWYKICDSFKHVFIAVLLKGYFPAQWNVAQIILILKPGKPHHNHNHNNNNNNNNNDNNNNNNNNNINILLANKPLPKG